MTVTAQTFLELQDAALHDDFDATKYRARVKVLLNEALARVGRRVYGLQRRSTASVSAFAGTSSYALPTDFVRAISLRDPALHPGTLDEVDPEWIDDQSTGRNTPLGYAIDGQSLVLWPTPTTATTFTLRYWATPAALAADGDVPAIPADYVDLLVTYARGKLYRLEDDVAMHDALMGQFDAGVFEAKADLQLTSLRRVRQIPGMWDRTARPAFRRPA